MIFYLKNRIKYILQHNNIQKLKGMINKMNTEKRLILIELKEDVNIEEILNKNGIKILENELIKNGTMNKVDNFFVNELRQEYLLNYEWFDKQEEEKNSALLEITAETYDKAE